MLIKVIIELCTFHFNSRLDVVGEEQWQSFPYTILSNIRWSYVFDKSSNRGYNLSLQYLERFLLFFFNTSMYQSLTLPLYFNRGWYIVTSSQSSVELCSLHLILSSFDLLTLHLLTLYPLILNFWLLILCVQLLTMIRWPYFLKVYMILSEYQS